MKKILVPSTKEESVFYCDFSGTCFRDYPDVRVYFEFNYGSKFDGIPFNLDLSCKESHVLLDLIKTKLTADKKAEISKSDAANNPLVQYLIS